MPAVRPRVQKKLTVSEIAIRDEKIWQLRIRKYSIRDIATQLGSSPSTVHTSLVRGYRERIYPQVDEVRKEQLELLDLMLNRLIPDIEDGSIPAIQAALKVEERRAKLLGLDAPVKVETAVQVHEVTQQDLELQELLRETEAREKLAVVELEAASAGQ